MYCGKCTLYAYLNKIGIGKFGVYPPEIFLRMKARLRAHIEYLDEVLYWVFVALVAIGVLSDQLVPSKMDAVVLSGIFFFCMVLKPMILIRGR